MRGMISPRGKRRQESGERREKKKRGERRQETADRRGCVILHSLNFLLSDIFLSPRLQSGKKKTIRVYSKGEFGSINRTVSPTHKSQSDFAVERKWPGVDCLGSGLLCDSTGLLLWCLRKLTADSNY